MINYPLSYQQERIWLMLTIYPEAASMWNIVHKVHFTGVLNIPILKEAFEWILQRHEVLTHPILQKDYVPYHCVNSLALDVDEFFNVYDLRGKDQEYQLEYLNDSFYKQRREHKFSLEKPHVLLSLFCLSDEHAVLFVNLHHIVADGRSREIFIKDLVSFYDLLVSNESVIHAKPALPFRTYIEAQRQINQAKDEDYWLGLFKKGYCPSSPTFPYDNPKRGERVFSAATSHLILEKEKVTQLRNVAFKHRVTPSSLFLAAIIVELWKYGGQNELVIGAYLEGRSFDTEVLNVKSVFNSMGMFVNTVLLKFVVDGNDTIMDFIKKVNDNYLKAYIHQNYPYQNLVNKLDIPRAGQHTSLFNIGYNYIKQGSNKSATNDLLVEVELCNEEIYIETDINFRIIDKGREIEICVDYNTALYNKKTIAEIVENYFFILNSITSSEGQILREIDLVLNDSFAKSIDAFNDTKKVYPEFQNSIFELFFNNAINFPTKTAIVFKDKEVVYEELHEKSNYLASLLLKQGIKKGDYVAVVLEHSVELVLSILSIFKVGGIYLPIDPSWPEERIMYILNEVLPSVIISSSKELLNAEKLSIPILNVDYRSLKSIQEFMGPVVALEDVAYLMYTSGSTGKPKGVLVTHGGLINRLLWMNDYLGSDSAKSVILTTRFIFDSSLWQILWPLINGGRCIVVRNLIEYSINEIYEVIESNQVSTIDFVPSYFELFTQGSFYHKIKSLRNVIVGGESIVVNTVKRFKNRFPDVNIFNFYGPTEATIGCIAYEISGLEDSVIPIGKPISNMHIVIVDDSLSIQPIGAPGEILILGIGLAKGYINDIESTSKAFISFKKYGYDRGYLTGDIGRYNSEGNIEYLGRKDSQIKLNGLRIEPGEIEFHLTNYSGINQAVVHLVDDINTQGKYLCGFFTSDYNVSISDLKAYLLNVLPVNVIPQFLIQVEKFDLTASGKIDKSTLKVVSKEFSPEDNLSDELFSQLEKDIATVWRQVLNLENDIPSINTSFFSVGGHSLKAMEMLLRIGDNYQTNLSLLDFFKSPTIKGLVEKIKTSTFLDKHTLVRAEATKRYSLSSQQQQMFILHYLEANKMTYNIPFCFKITGQIDSSKFREALIKLVERHEVLRYYFKIEGNSVSQLVMEEFDLPFTYLDWHPDIDGKKLQTEFDLMSGPMFKVDLFNFKDQFHILFFEIHHIIFDGMSADIFFRELSCLLSGLSLTPSNPFQYKDYIASCKNDFHKQVIRKQEEYWKKSFNGFTPKALFVQDNIEADQRDDFSAGHLTIRITGVLMRNLDELRVKFDCTNFVLLFTLFNLMLHEISGENVIVVGCPISGRRHSDLKDIIGIFANTLPIKVELDPTNTFKQFILDVKATVVNALENQEFPIEEISKFVNYGRPVRTPLIQSIFGYQNDYKTEFRTETILIERSNCIENIQRKTKSPLCFWCKESSDMVIIDVEYSKNLFRLEEIITSLQMFESFITSLVTNSSCLIRDLLQKNSVDQQ